MRKYLIFLSFCCVLLYGCGTRRAMQASPAGEVCIWDSANRTEGINRYRVNISFANAGISGIMAVREEDGVFKGTMLNEFGIRGFNFTCSAGNTALSDVMTFIDKWYIRRTIAADLQMLFCADDPDYRRSAKLAISRDDGKVTVRTKDSRKAVVRDESGNVVMKNVKRGITYSLSVML